MLKRTHCYALVLLLAAPATFAQQALVRNYDNSSLEVGQAYLTHYGERCLAILPTHVVTEAGNSAALLREGTTPVLGETTATSDLGDDVSVADLIGGVQSDCGFSTLTVSRAVDRRIRANALASIRSVNGDGSIAQISVTIIDDDGELFLRVQPTNNNDQLRKGLSGSLLMSGDSPIGMLLSVDARFGIGKVIRLDKMFSKIDAFLRGQAQAALVATKEPGDSSARSDASGVVSSWSAMSIDSIHRAVNLLAGGDEPPWIAKVDAWPVELELALGDDRIAIAGIELDATGETAAASRPTTVELFVSSVDDGRRWRSLGGGTPDWIEGKAIFRTAPSWARHIKLVISGAEGDGNRVALRRLRVLPAN